MVAPSQQNSTLALIDELLAEQQRLQTPVAVYSHAHNPASPGAPPYRDLIPLTTPQPGEQYAFEVDLDACSGCKACVAACHSLNGLDQSETWRDVGLMLGGDNARPFQQTVTTACHHCADPGCLNGCPVLAYEKDPETGIVRHLDDQCIGCSYCILKCPYDVPKYSSRLGIVRKCDMCHGRLSAGEPPACAAACPTRAIRIVTVAVAGTHADTSAFLPGAPDPKRTQPTTRYVSRRSLPANLQPADASAPRPQPAHTPLALMLLGTQLAVGLQAGAAWSGAGDGGLALTALAFGGAGLVSSVLHLGRPLRAWRVFLGVRRSWLSREALVLTAWFAISGAALVVSMPAEVPVVIGLFGLFCSAMIYIDTGRRAWRALPTFVAAFGTAGIAAAAAFTPAAAAVALAAKLAAERLFERSAPASSRLLKRGPLRRMAISRRLLGVFSVPLLLLGPVEPGAVACGLLLGAIGEGLEKLLFFRAVDPSRMPGFSA